MLRAGTICASFASNHLAAEVASSYFPVCLRRVGDGILVAPPHTAPSIELSLIGHQLWSISERHSTDAVCWCHLAAHYQHEADLRRGGWKLSLQAHGCSGGKTDSGS